MSGADNDGTGLSTQCECSIKIKDVNDNFPVLRESQVYPLILEEPFLYMLYSLASQFINCLFGDFLIFCAFLFKKKSLNVRIEESV